MTRRWRNALGVALLLALAASQAYVALHYLEGDHDESCSSDGCAVCAWAHTPATTAGPEVALIVEIAMGETAAPALPALCQSYCRFPFGPRAPPATARL